MAKKATTGPWMPPAYHLADVAAIQALERGDATKEQQQRALKWVVDNACGTYDISYRPGEDGRRDTDFAEGKRFVGSQIVKLLKLNLALLRRSNVD